MGAPDVTPAGGDEQTHGAVPAHADVLVVGGGVGRVGGARGDQGAQFNGQGGVRHRGGGG